MDSALPCGLRTSELSIGWPEVFKLVKRITENDILLQSKNRDSFIRSIYNLGNFVEQIIFRLLAAMGFQLTYGSCSRS